MQEKSKNINNLKLFQNIVFSLAFSHYNTCKGSDREKN